jgi:hypothetical protein
MDAGDADCRLGVSCRLLFGNDGDELGNPGVVVWLTMAAEH